MADPAGARSRALAARAVDGVIQRGMTLESALEGAMTGAGEPALEPRDRASIQALAFGAIRWHHRHQALLALLLDRPLRPRDQILEAVLSVGLFELADPERPDYPAVSAAVAASRLLGHERAAGLVNATLRRFQREAPALGERISADEAARYSHPAWLIRRFHQDWPGSAPEILAANQRHPPLWIRVNTRRIALAGYATRLATELGTASSELAIAPQALRVLEPAAASRLPGFGEGLVSIQDAAAQLAAPLLGASAGMRVLDACAAPGGKTTHLLELANGDLDLTALDISAGRLEQVAGNLARLGLRATLLVGDACRPADWWDGRPFDRILVDAPCSATGVIRRHPDIKCLRRESDLPALASRQLALLTNLWPLLRPGGRLLYSTCSLLADENENLVAAFATQRQEVRRLPTCLPSAVPGMGADSVAPALQLVPGPADTDGFYYALMESLPG